MSVFEIVMLVCFGTCWPFSIYKSWKEKSVRGKSIVFLWLIFIGYLSGVIHKVMYNYNWIITLYIFNGTMVLIDISFYYYYRYTVNKKGAKI